jgi:hypothetical protein
MLINFFYEIGSFVFFMTVMFIICLILMAFEGKSNK